MLFNKKNHKPTINILDHVEERCLRQEAALDRAIKDKGIYASGISNFGEGYIARSGIQKEKLPCIEVDDLCFFPRVATEELTYDSLCRFLDMLVNRGILHCVCDVD